MALPPINRLPAGEIKGLWRRAGVASDEMAVIRFRRQGRAASRFAVIISRKVASSSVERNALRRRISGWLQENLPRLAPGFDAVLILKRKASELTRREFYSLLGGLFKKTPLL